MQGKFPTETNCKVFEDKTLIPNFSRRDKNVPAFTSEKGFNGRLRSLQLYLPCRTAVVLAKEK